MRKKVRYVLLVIALGIAVWVLSGRDPAPASSEAAPPPVPVLSIPRGAGEVADTPRPAHVAGTEEALVEAVARAIERRDLAALQAAVAPELAAELARLHGQSPEAFWQRGARWVENLASGFVIGARADQAAESWRALIRFGNGQVETVVFSRFGGKLVFEEL